MSGRSQREVLWGARERIERESFERRHDALFGLLDALLIAGSVPSFVHLSLARLFRRGHGCAYDALAGRELDVPSPRVIVASYPLDDGAPLDARDTRVWLRRDAECSPRRGYDYSASRQSAGQPIVAGWSYAWLAQRSVTHEGWDAPTGRAARPGPERRVPRRCRTNPGGSARAASGRGHPRVRLRRGLLSRHGSPVHGAGRGRRHRPHVVRLQGL